MQHLVGALHSYFMNSAEYESETAVDVKCSFSHGQILINHLCNWLPTGSIHALMCFGDWCRLQLVSDSDLAAAIGSQDATEKRRGKATERDV